jgi:ABC-type transport system involved in cytochrome bd biosynthesis fused ATPase/permease subunit
MKKRSGFKVMSRLIGLVKPLTGVMVLAILMGLLGHMCATFITVFGGYAVLTALNVSTPFSLMGLFVCVAVFAVARGVLRYAEQACNHFIAFKLLALIRDRVFMALRRLCPAKLEGRDKGNLISVITSDIELLEVFYAHTISPAAIALLFTVAMTLFIGSYHWALGLLALAAYIIVGVVIPLAASKFSGNSGMKFRTKFGELSAFVLDSLRGLTETIQYGQGKKRLEEMMKKTDGLAGDEEKMKRSSGRNAAVTNTVVLAFDLIMLFASAMLFRSGAVNFDGVLIPTVALFSSFGPVIALAGLGSTLQNTFAAGNRVLDILDETPIVEEVSGKPQVSFSGAKAEHVTFSYGQETILSDATVFPRRSLCSDFKMTASFKLSKLLVGSSRSINGASWRNALASPRRWRSPPESVSPSSPTGVSYPWGSVIIKSCTDAFLQASTISSSEASSFAIRRLFLMLS